MLVTHWIKFLCHGDFYDLKEKWHKNIFKIIRGGDWQGCRHSGNSCACSRICIYRVGVIGSALKIIDIISKNFR